jgi:hypothetical protein
MIKRIVFINLLLFLCSAAVPQKTPLSWPEITRENKPWTRWWWPGSIVNTNDLTVAMEKYKKAGLGGLELTVIYGVKGQEDKFINYLSPEWMEMFTYTLKEAERLDLGIDLANASGWPFGGPWVDPADACRTIDLKTWSLKEGMKLNEKVEFIQQPLIKAVNQAPDIRSLIDPIGKNKDLQRYAIEQIRFEKPLPLYILMTFSDSGKVLNLTDRITPEKYLDWTAPSGNWTLYAIFNGWLGKQVERAGPGGEGDVIDHFSGTAVFNYLKHFDDTFRKYNLKSLRGYFNDSYEVDEAASQSDWTNDLLYEFAVRRGYDLSYHLPALFQKDTPGKNAGVLSDYRQTMSDLILEKFTVQWTDWAHRQGKLTRDQAHGSPGNILDLYAASDIPETEGNDLAKFKFASSAGNVTSKKFISCEAATWLGEHFTSSLADVRKAVDRFFLAGINHIFYHGTCFSPQNEQWPGFLFYASTEFTPVNPLWNDFGALNKYVGHVQSFLQDGRSDNDILLYFPIFDIYAEYNGPMLEHFDAIDNRFDGTAFKTGAEKMLESGYLFDYISDLQIKKTEVDGDFLRTGGNFYRTIVIPGCKYIPIETFMHIIMLANNGATVIFYGTMPENVAGWADLEAKTSSFRNMKEKLKFTETNNRSVAEASVGQGKILMGNNIEDLLSYAGIQKESMTISSLKCVRRATNKGYNYFVVNTGDNPFAGWITLNVKGISAAIFNPATEEMGIASSRLSKEGQTEVYARINSGESLIISVYRTVVSGEPYRFYDKNPAPLEIKGTWKVDFIEGGPVLPQSTETDRLISWTEFGGDDVKNFSGTAKYTISFRKPSGNGDAWLIDLGKVHESAEVSLNGKEVATLTGPHYQIIVDKNQLKSSNILEIKTSNLMANRIAYLDRNKIQWKKFYNINFVSLLSENFSYGKFDASSWKPRESGLLGPVTITALKIMK